MGRRRLDIFWFHLTRSLLEGKRATTNVLHWRSGKLQRTVNSTLAAETQSLARGVGDLVVDDDCV